MPKLRRTKKGGCGCQSNNNNVQPSSSGLNKITGGMGPESTINIDSKYVIPYNTSIGGLGTDPLDPSNLISTRTQPIMVGGKRKKRRSNKKSSKIKSRKTKKARKYRKTRKYKGGEFMAANTGNIQASFMQSSGAQTAANVMHGTNSSSLNSEPQMMKYGPYI
jgi:hypothetical protein